MIYEPPIDHAHLIATINNEYGVVVDRLTFVPVGFAAACYVAHCHHGTRRFVKLWPARAVNQATLAQHDMVLRLVHAVHERVLRGRVPYPIPTRTGGLWAMLDRTPFAVFPFFPGHAPADPMPSTLRDEWARTMATLHRATPALRDVLPPRETFDLPFEADLRRGLAALEQIGPQVRPGLHALRELVLPRREETWAQLARLHRLQPVVRRLAGPFVLCHTDMGGDNLLVNDQGTLIVLDWDEATVAPPEHDLHEARGHEFARFVDVYAEAGGAGPLHRDHFAFALLRRHMGDMTARLVRMLHEHTAADEDADALHGIQAWGFGQWEQLDETLDSIAAALGHRST